MIPVKEHVHVRKMSMRRKKKRRQNEVKKKKWKKGETDKELKWRNHKTTKSFTLTHPYSNIGIRLQVMTCCSHLHPTLSSSVVMSRNQCTHLSALP